MWLIARVPGIGTRNAKRITALRRERRICYDDLVRMRCQMKKLASFVTTSDYRPTRTADAPSQTLRRELGASQSQLSLFPEITEAS